MTSKVVVIDESNVSVLRTGIVVVDFFAPWCGPCKRLATPFELRAAGCSANVVFAKVDGDENEMLMEEFDVKAYPTVMVLRDGKRIKSVEGCDESELAELVDLAIGYAIKGK